MTKNPKNPDLSARLRSSARPNPIARLNRESRTTLKPKKLFSETSQFRVVLFEYPGAGAEWDEIVGASTHEDAVRAFVAHVPFSDWGFCSVAEVTGPLKRSGQTTKKFDPRGFQSTPNPRFDTHTCPRCSGMPRAFAHFPHINQGKCLLCNGRLTVSAAQARAFIAAQHRGMLMPEDATAGVPEESGDVKLGEKSVQIPRLSRARIQAWRQPDGAVRFVLLSASDVGTLSSGFRLVRGKVVPEGVCNGHLTALGRVAGFTKALQDAHDRAARAKAKPNPIKPARRQQPLEEMVGTTHFGQRLWERLKGVSERKQKRALAVYTTLKLQRARTAGLNGRYAVQFGGESREAGDYLVVQIDHGAVTGFISVLINQLVIHPHTSIVSAKQLGIAYENPRRTSRRIRIPTSR